jgi:hypothetical protein
MNVKRAHPSSFSRGRWECDLACGHSVWVTSEDPPETATCKWGCVEAAPPASPAGGGGETPETAAFKERWGVELHCRVCNAVFELERSGFHVSLQPSKPFTRLIMFAAPEVCPTCKSLHSLPPLSVVP